jgi:hypothetical protein
MIYMLNSNSPQIQLSVCKHVIQFASDLRRMRETNDNILGAFTALI